MLLSQTMTVMTGYDVAETITVLTGILTRLLWKSGEQWTRLIFRMPPERLDERKIQIPNVMIVNLKLGTDCKNAKWKPLVVYSRDRSLKYKLVRSRLPVNTTLPVTKDHNMVLSQMQSALFCHRDPSSQLS